VCKTLGECYVRSVDSSPEDLEPHKECRRKKDDEGPEELIQKLEGTLLRLGKSKGRGKEIMKWKPQK